MFNYKATLNLCKYDVIDQIPKEILLKFSNVAYDISLFIFHFVKTNVAHIFNSGIQTECN